MKRVYSFRLSGEAKAAIVGAAEDGKCSEGEVVEGWALGKTGGVKLPERVKKRVEELAKDMGLSEWAVLEMAVMEFRERPTLDTSPLRYLGRAGESKVDTSGVSYAGPPEYSFGSGVGGGTDVPKTDKRAVFEALKAKIAGGEALDAPVEEKPLSETPVAPFAFMMDGEEHKVMQSGKKLGIYYFGSGEPVFTRPLKEGELEQLWEKRIR